MLVSQIAEIEGSVVFVLRVVPVAGKQGQHSIGVAGTACYLGKDIFVTADHLFRDPPHSLGGEIKIGSVLGNGMILPTSAIVETSLPGLDLALLRVPGCGGTFPASKISVAGEPVGRSVFSYAFINPSVAAGPNGPVITAFPRACPSIIGSKAFGKYELDGEVYPGESGGPVFRLDNPVVVAVINGRRCVEVRDPSNPASMIKDHGPTMAGPVVALAAELARLGVPVVP